MPHDLPKAYEPGTIEPRWADYWIQEKLFHVETPAPDSKQPVFTLTLPPPNITGRLHMGHMLNQTEMDIVVRWHRMRGFVTLWLPGTDHAGIATQMMVERALASEGKNRRDMTREAFIERVWCWKKHYGGAILDQMKRLGASVDWSREFFTMSDGLSHAVREGFVQLHEEGLIYRGKYIVNWCPRCITAVSDLEVIHEETQGKIYELRYPVVGSPNEFIVVATTRPETMLGDTAVAVNSADERYKQLHGKKVLLPLMNREIPIITDDILANPEFGTGAVKVTPSHDPNDFEAGLRNALPQIEVMNEIAQMTANAGPYAGLDRFEARQKVLEDLEKGGFLVGAKDYVVPLGKCDRCKTIIEPRLSTQWFVKIQPLADRAIEVVEKGEVKFVPENYAKTYFEWMRNIHDWCISRQLWWGHRIPAWYCKDCGEIIVARETPTKCTKCAGSKLEQDTDVLDTWFSSALWPFSTLGWPDQTPELKRFYPTSTLVTGFDIIFFWVARMMMMGLHFMEQVPFHDVYIHALVRDERGQKMSKSKGNVIDPLAVIDEYGADALRFTLAAMAAQGRDIKLSAQRVEGYRNFATKLWNAARFTEINGCARDPAFDPRQSKEVLNRWIAHETAKTASDVTAAIEAYKFNDAAGAVYRFVWNVYCDWYLELIKPVLSGPDGTAKSETRAAATWALEEILKLLHPFMPFVTEELWRVTGAHREPLLALSSWSQFDNVDAPDAEAEIGWVIDLITAIRSVRVEMNIPPATSLPLVLAGVSSEIAGRARRWAEFVKRLARVGEISFAEAAPRGAVQLVVRGDVAALPLKGVIDLAAERARLAKEIAKCDADIARVDAKLGNPNFAARAPEEVVEEEKEKREEAQLRKAKLADALQRLEGAE